MLVQGFIPLLLHLPMLNFACTVSSILQTADSSLALDVIKQSSCQFGVTCTLDRSTLPHPLRLSDKDGKLDMFQLDFCCAPSLSTLR